MSMSWLVMVKLLPEMVIKWSENKVSSWLGLKICLRVIEICPPRSSGLRGGVAWTASANY
jgi:hypothetical protein